jgi:hypothetical protein
MRGEDVDDDQDWLSPTRLGKRKASRRLARSPDDKPSRERGGRGRRSGPRARARRPAQTRMPRRMRVPRSARTVAPRRTRACRERPPPGSWPAPRCTPPDRRLPHARPSQNAASFATGCRFDSSLGMLTKKFLNLIETAEDGILDLNQAADILQASGSRPPRPP